MLTDSRRKDSDTSAGFEVLYLELFGEAESESSNRIKPVCLQHIQPGRTIPESIHSKFNIKF